MMQDEQIPLTEAAHRLSMSWERAWRALLSGYLDGEKCDGRWFVSADSVTRYSARRAHMDEMDLAANARPEGK